MPAMLVTVANPPLYSHFAPIGHASAHEHSAGAVPPPEQKKPFGHSTPVAFGDPAKHAHPDCAVHVRHALGDP